MGRRRAAGSSDGVVREAFCRARLTALDRDQPSQLSQRNARERERGGRRNGNHNGRCSAVRAGWMRAADNGARWALKRESQHGREAQRHWLGEAAAARARVDTTLRGVRQDAGLAQLDRVT